MDRGLEAVVLDFMQHNAGKVLVAHPVMMGTGYDKNQVSGALARLAKNPTSGVTRVGVGAYRYSPIKEDEKQSLSPSTVLYEQIAELRDGEVLLQSEVGTLWIARPHLTRLAKP